ncbi:MAG TPA: hypothetical protein VGK21_00490 [Candidatus Angelobacter sp.]
MLIIKKNMFGPAAAIMPGAIDFPIRQKGLALQPPTHPSQPTHVGKAGSKVFVKVHRGLRISYQRSWRVLWPF